MLNSVIVGFTTDIAGIYPVYSQLPASVISEQFIRAHIEQIKVSAIAAVAHFPVESSGDTFIFT